jgi:hypothetical protein
MKKGLSLLATVNQLMDAKLEGVVHAQQRQP